MARVTVVSGSGRFADPWHPLAETSARVADVLRGAGHEVTVTDDVDGTLAAFGTRAGRAGTGKADAEGAEAGRAGAGKADAEGAEARRAGAEGAGARRTETHGVRADAPDLLVLNVGAGRMPEERAVVESSDARQAGEGGPSGRDTHTDAATRAGLLAYVDGGRPLLALHVSSTSFGFVPEWEQVLGGIWVRGTSMHPPYSRARIGVATDAHAITRGVHDFELDDERYSHLRVSPAARQLAWHDLDSVRNPVLWTHGYGDARIVYDALGHDSASYDSAAHRAILAQAAEWLLG